MGVFVLGSGDEARALLYTGLLRISAPANAPEVGLQYRLLAEPIDPASLPNGFVVGEVRPHPISERLRTHRAVAGLNILLRGRGAELSNRIGYRIFPSSADAAGYFAPADLGPEFALISRSAPVDTGDEFRCETYRYVTEDAPITGTDCLQLVDDVVVVGPVAQEGTQDQGQTERAGALA